MTEYVVLVKRIGNVGYRHFATVEADRPAAAVETAMRQTYGVKADGQPRTRSGDVDFMAVPRSNMHHVDADEVTA